jgi:hypothetical protein
LLSYIGFRFYQYRIAKVGGERAVEGLSPSCRFPLDSCRNPQHCGF